MFETNLTELENITIERSPLFFNGMINNTEMINATIEGNLTVWAYVPMLDYILQLILVCTILLTVILFILILMLIRRRKVIL